MIGEAFSSLSNDEKKISFNTQVYSRLVLNVARSHLHFAKISVSSGFSMMLSFDLASQHDVALNTTKRELIDIRKLSG